MTNMNWESGGITPDHANEIEMRLTALEDALFGDRVKEGGVERRNVRHGIQHQMTVVLEDVQTIKSELRNGGIKATISWVQVAKVSTGVGATMTAIAALASALWG